MLLDLGLSVPMWRTTRIARRRGDGAISPERSRRVREPGERLVRRGRDAPRGADRACRSRGRRCGRVRPVTEWCARTLSHARRPISTPWWSRCRSPIPSDDPCRRGGGTVAGASPPARAGPSEPDPHAAVALRRPTPSWPSSSRAARRRGAVHVEINGASASASALPRSCRARRAPSRARRALSPARRSCSRRGRRGTRPGACSPRPTPSRPAARRSRPRRIFSRSSDACRASRLPATRAR